MKMNHFYPLSAYQIAAALLAVGGITLVSSGCGTSASDAVQDAKEAVSANELQHTWTGACGKSVALTVVGSSELDAYNFAGANIKKTENYYSTGDCANAAVSVVYSGTFSKGDQVQNNVNAIDITYKQVQVTALNADGQKLLSGANFCGVSNWSINTPVDLTANSGGNLCPLNKMPEVVYDIYDAQNSTLIFGTGADKKSADHRPSQLDNDHPYKMQ